MMALAKPARGATPSTARGVGEPAEKLAGRSPRLATALARPQPRRQYPSAIEWQDTALPGVGHLRAIHWLPTVLVAACALALAYLTQTSGVATTGYDIQRLNAERQEWTLRNEQLRLELSKLGSLAWVEAEATTRLGMERAASPVYLPAPPSWAER